MKTVGILGGMGPLATQAFYGQLVRQTDASRDQEHVHVVMDADPTIPDRTAFLLGSGADPRPKLIAAARRLGGLGAGCVVMPCNTASAFAADVAAATGVPVMPWIGPALGAVHALGVRSVGLLATTGTVRAGLYARGLEEHGIEAVVPEPDDQERVMEIIYGPGGVKARGAADDGTKRALVRVAGRLREAGAQAVILGCTELPITVSSYSRRWPVRAVDPAVHVARAVIRFAGGRVRVPG